MSQRYVSAVQRFYDQILQHGLGAFDKNKAIATLMFPNALYVDPVRGPRAFAEYTGEVYSNMALQGALLRGLSSLSRLNGEDRYREAAEESIRFFLGRYQCPQTGLLPWGGHVAVDLTSGLPSTMDDPGVWARHELKAHQPPWDMMWALNSPATERFVWGFWREHVRDDGSYMFSRHGDLFGITSARSLQRRLSGNDGCQFMTTALDLAAAALLLWAKTRRRGWLNHATGIVKNFDDHRDPNTGLGATSFTRGKRPPLLERHCIGRYTKCATIGLQLGERFGGEGRLFLDTALRDLLAFGNHAYDEEDKGFFVRRWLSDGSRIERVGRPPIEISAYGVRGINDTRNPALPALLYSYALAWRLTREPQLRPTIDRLLYHLGSDDGFGFSLQGSEAAAYVLQALLELAAADQDKQWRDLAHAVAERALARFLRDDGYFFDWPDSELCRLGQRLPLALLRLAATEQGRPDAIDADPGGGTYLDPNPKIRWRFDRHTYRLRSARLDCIVGDRYPHGGTADGEWNRAGVHALSHIGAASNLFDAELGGLVFEPLADIHPNCNIVLLSPTAVMLENAKELCAESGQAIPTLVASVYSLSDSNALDLDVRLLPLLVEGEDALVVMCDSAFAPNATASEVPGWPAVAVQQGTVSAVLMARREHSVRLMRSGANRVRFEWRIPAATGMGQCLRMRIVASDERIDAASECCKFASLERPDIRSPQREAVATVQMVTST